MNIILKFIFAVILTIISLTFEYSFASSNVSSTKITISNQSQMINTLRPFNAISTSGTVNYRITVGGSTNSIEVLGNPAEVPTMQYTITNGVLKLSYKSKKMITHSEPLLVILHTAQLNRINQSGSGSVTINYLTPQMLVVNKSGTGTLIINGKVQLVQLNTSGPGNVIANQIKTSNLYMNVRTSGVIKLTGIVSLVNLNFSGPGTLKMYWIKSGNLTVKTAGSGTVALAGVAQIVNAYAYDHSHLNLRFLRAKTMFVKSYQHASVDVWAQNNLFALSNNNSNIYYYTDSIYESRMMEQSGTVLPMWDIPGAIVSFNTK